MFRKTPEKKGREWQWSHRGKEDYKDGKAKYYFLDFNRDGTDAGLRDGCRRLFIAHQFVSRIKKSPDLLKRMTKLDKVAMSKVEGRIFYFFDNVEQHLAVPEGLRSNFLWDIRDLFCDWVASVHRMNMMLSTGYEPALIDAVLNLGSTDTIDKHRIFDVMGEVMLILGLVRFKHKRYNPEEPHPILTSKNGPKKSPTDNSADRPRERSRDTPREKQRDTPRENPRDRARENSRERPRERSSGRPRHADNSKGLPKDRTRDRSRNRSKERDDRRGRGRRLPSWLK